MKIRFENQEIEGTPEEVAKFSELVGIDWSAPNPSSSCSGTKVVSGQAKRVTRTSPNSVSVNVDDVLIGLKKLKKREGYTYDELGTMIGVSGSTVANWATRVSQPNQANQLSIALLLEQEGMGDFGFPKDQFIKTLVLMYRAHDSFDELSSTLNFSYLTPAKVRSLMYGFQKLSPTKKHVRDHICRIGRNQYGA